MDKYLCLICYSIIMSEDELSSLRRRVRDLEIQAQERDWSEAWGQHENLKEQAENETDPTRLGIINTFKSFNYQRAKMLENSLNFSARIEGKNVRYENGEIITYSNDSSACFIATAVYGTPFCEELDILRRFRDKSMRTNLIGNILVKLYYKISPPIADFIRNRYAFRRMTKDLVVQPAVDFLRKYTGDSLNSPNVS